MKKIPTSLSMLLVAVVLFLSSCKNSKDQETELEFESLSKAELDTTLWSQKDSVLNSTQVPEFDARIFGKGATWKAWEKIHKECFKADWFESPYYMGVTSKIPIGSITDKNDQLQLRLQDGFDSTEMKTIIQEGNFTSCTYLHSTELNMDILLQGSVDITQDVEQDIELELGTKLNRSKKTSIKIESWRVNTLVLKLMNELLKKNDDEKKVLFKQTLKTKGNRLLTKVAEIKGFSSIIEFDSDMSPELQAKLKEGIIANVGSGSLEAKIKFKTSKSIEMISTGNVFVFVEMVKGKKI